MGDKHLATDRLTIATLAYNEKVRSLAEETNERLTHETVFYQQEYPDRRTGDELAHGT
jgi:hypothetical protein